MLFCIPLNILHTFMELEQIIFRAVDDFETDFNIVT